MPVPRMSMRKRLDYPFGGKSSYYERVFIDVNVIIKIDEIMSQCLTEYTQGDCHEAKAYQEIGDPWFRMPSADSRTRGGDTGRMLSTVRNLASFCAAGARATSCHLLYLDHVAVSRIVKEQYYFPVRQPKQGSLGQLLIRPRAGRFQPPRQNVHSLHTPPRALYKSLESCRLRYEALSRQVRPPAFHLGLKLRERLQTPMQDCSQRFRSLVALPALPATAQ